MAKVPLTSISLLKGLAQADSVRWTEFMNLYEESMRAFLLARYPSLEADDIIQETVIALAQKMPGYRYSPDVNGHFRNYLTGILRHKAEDALRRRARESAKHDLFAHHVQMEGSGRNAEEDEKWKLAAMNAAIEQLLLDDTLSPLNREVFRHVALLHEPPEDVAAAFGITRDNVDQIKHRCIKRLQSRITAMTDTL